MGLLYPPSLTFLQLIVLYDHKLEPLAEGPELEACPTNHDSTPNPAEP